MGLGVFFYISSLGLDYRRRFLILVDTPGTGVFLFRFS